MGANIYNFYLNAFGVLESFQTTPEQLMVPVTVEVNQDQSSTISWGGAVRGYFMMGITGGVVGITTTDNSMETHLSLENIAKIF